LERKSSGSLLFLLKALLFCAMLSIFFVGQNLFYAQTVFYFWGNNIVLFIYALILFFTCKIYSGFLFGMINYSEILLSWTLCLLITNTIQYLQLSLQSFAMLPVLGFAVIFAAQVLLAAPMTYGIDRLFYRLNPAYRAVVIYGSEEKARGMCDILQKNHEKFAIFKQLSQTEPKHALMNGIDSAESVFFLDVDEKTRETLFDYCFKHNKRIYILPTFSGVLLNTAEVSWISNTPMFLPKNPLPDAGTRAVKRCMDVVLSLLAILLLSWLMLIIWLAIRLYDRRPALYKQTRVTINNKHFTLYKFRSMRPDAESDGVARLASENDDRVTPVGKVIRKTRMDELPQLFNILSGSMSLVGPRPERPEIAAQYEAIYPNFSFRTKVKAGLTGFAQIYGRYNTAPDEKLFLDIMYIERFSIWQDIKLILQTVKVLFLSSGTEGVKKDETTAMKGR
jgi:exopolysaccharide biosynthesis polyprenyl glycosylphosphotransferase